MPLHEREGVSASGIDQLRITTIARASRDEQGSTGVCDINVEACGMCFLAEITGRI